MLIFIVGNGNHYLGSALFARNITNNHTLSSSPLSFSTPMISSSISSCSVAPSPFQKTRSKPNSFPIVITVFVQAAPHSRHGVQIIDAQLIFIYLFNYFGILFFSMFLAWCSWRSPTIFASSANRLRPSTLGLSFLFLTKTTWHCTSPPKPKIKNIHTWRNEWLVHTFRLWSLLLCIAYQPRKNSPEKFSTNDHLERRECWQ